MVTEADIERAADIIRQGGLVAFPTETVYGLGGNALSGVAVERIFAAKGRPAASPLIVHVAGIELARQLSSDWTREAAKLARRFWPGPLTLVVPKHPAIPRRVTAGLDTVGLRMPAHPVALALIRAAGVPLAAPSANRFSELSPTTAEHVKRGLGNRVDMILDGGPTNVGIESTVLSIAAGRWRILRPGMISREQLETVIGPVEFALAADGEAHAAPGMHAKHYSPRTPLRLLPWREGALHAYGRGRERSRTVEMPADPESYASCLYAVLHELDAEGWDEIEVEMPPQEAEWAGVIDRLCRAAVQ